MIVTTGKYQGKTWAIDSKRRLRVSRKKVVPFSPHQIWIDHDHYSKVQFKEHYAYLDKLTNDLAATGQDYFVLFMTHPEIGNIGDLKKSSVQKAFESEWKKFAPVITKSTLRGMTYYNEINAIVAPKDCKGTAIAAHAKTMNEYAKSMKQIVADVPVLLKICGDWNIEPIMEAIVGTYVDGLGGDFFATEVDETLWKQMQRPLTMLNHAKKTKLFWITELSWMTGKEPNVQWPPFKSKAQMKAFLDVYLNFGATGIWYFPINNRFVTAKTLQWFNELKPDFVNRMKAL